MARRDLSSLLFSLKVFASSITFLFFGIFALEASFDYATAFSCVDCVRLQIFVRTNFLPFQAYVPYFVPGVIALTLSGAFLVSKNYKLVTMATGVFLFEAWVVFYSPFSPLWHAALDPATSLYRYIQERPVFLENNNAGDVQAFYGFGGGMISLFVCLVLSKREAIRAFILTCLIGCSIISVFEIGIFFILNASWESQVTLFQGTILPAYVSTITNRELFEISMASLLTSLTLGILKLYSNRNLP